MSTFTLRRKNAGSLGRLQVTSLRGQSRSPAQQFILRFNCLHREQFSFLLRGENVLRKNSPYICFCEVFRRRLNEIVIKLHPIYDIELQISG